MPKNHVCGMLLDRRWRSLPPARRAAVSGIRRDTFWSCAIEEQEANIRQRSHRATSACQKRSHRRVLFYRRKLKKPLCGNDFAMVVCAVRHEPVSLLLGPKQGDFREKQREDCRKYEKPPKTGHFSFIRLNR
jgi:hypothetical protein